MRGSLRGGPAFRIMQRVGLIKGNGPSIVRRSLAFIGVTWFPLFVLATLEGHAIGPTPRLAFLLDFASYARFLIAVPLIFAAEAIVGPRIRAAGLRFLQADIVSQADDGAFAAAVARVRRRRDAVAPELLSVLAAGIGAWFVTVEQLGGLSNVSWHGVSPDSYLGFRAAGLWYHFIAIPLVQFFLLRWLWRLAIWTLSLWDVSRLRLRLYATHSDMAGGLGFLGVAHASLAIFPFAMSCVFAAEVAFRIQFEGLDLAALRSMIPLLIAYLIVVEAVTFGPLLVVVPVLARVRLEGLRAYGILVQHHNRLFHEKWIEPRTQGEPDPLGDPDMSSLIDLGDSYRVVRQMSVFPVGRRQIVQVAAVACLPGLPLMFLVLPIAEVVKLLAGVVL
jgi:hypothetical protein